MALKSAKVADMEVKDSWDLAIDWLEGSWLAANPDGFNTLGDYDQSLFGYLWGEKFGRECIGLVSAVFQGRQNGDVILETLANTVMAQDLPTFAKLAH